MANPHNPVTIVTGGGNLVTAVTDGGNPVTAVTSGGNLVTLATSGMNPVTFIGGIPGAGWGYRKSLTLTGSIDGALTNHQVRVVVNYGSGVDADADVYLDSKSQSDFSDIRFTKSDGTALDHFRETPFTSGDSATFFVEVDSISASPATTDIYIYYGNSSAVTASNGANTFPDFFDDFDNSFTHLWPASCDSGQLGGFDPVSRRMYLLEMETGDGVPYPFGIWSNIDTGECGSYFGHPLGLVISGTVYHPVDKLFYVYGGQTGYTDTPYSTAVYTYDPLTDTWAALTEVLLDAAELVAPVYDPVSGDIFIFGGATSVANIFVDTIAVHDTTANTITDTTASLFTASWGHSPIYANGYIYLFGGTDNTGTRETHNWIYKYNPATPTVDPTLVTATLSENRDTAITWKAGEYIYIAAGYSYTSGEEDYWVSIDRLDLSDDSISTITETIYTGDDDAIAYYDSVNEKAYIGPMRSSLAVGNDKYKRIMLEFDPVTETFLEESGVSTTPSGWTSNGSSGTQLPRAMGSSFMSVEDHETGAYVRAQANFTALAGKKVLEFFMSMWTKDATGSPDNQVYIKQQGTSFTSEHACILRLTKTSAPNNWRIQTNTGTETIAPTVSGGNVVSAVIDVDAETAYGLVDYANATTAEAWDNAAVTLNQIWMNTPTASEEGFLVDWVRVRSWTTNEPAYTTWGSEESGPEQPA